jgi:hypothetical protein
VSEVVVAPSVESRRRTSVVATTIIGAAVVAVSIIFAAQTTWYFVFKMIHVGAAVIWVGGGLFIACCAIAAELANDDDQLFQIGRLADQVAAKLFPLMSFVVLGFGIAMTANGDIGYNQFWIVFGLIAWAVSAQVTATTRSSPAPRYSGPSFSSSVRSSSPLCASSSTMSAPPTSSPPTKTCGIVGQPESAESSWRIWGSGRMSTAVTGAPAARNASSARWELPHITNCGVPFMNSATSSVSMICLICALSSVNPLLSS